MYHTLFLYICWQNNLCIPEACHLIHLYFSRLREIGRGLYPFLEGLDNPHIDDLPSSSTKGSIVKSLHCSHCGHPGSKKNHSKVGCNYCLVDALENCVEKPAGFKCECPSCEKVGFVLI
jgi:flap endonuclease GEN